MRPTRCLSSAWRTRPIRRICEVVVRDEPLRYCGKESVAAYPALGGGWMSLCGFHSRSHPEATPILTLLRKGEQLAP